jgi:hypothetical protein
MQRLFQHCAHYLAHAVVLTTGLALIQPSASAQAVAADSPPIADSTPASEGADSLGEIRGISIDDGVGGAIGTEARTWNENAEETDGKLEPKTFDRLTLSIGSLRIAN